MKTLKEYIAKAEQNKVAIGHFNISDIVALRAIVEAASSLSLPVIIGVSQRERKFLGTKIVVSLVHCLREEQGLPLFLNADHCRTFDSFKEAVDTGYDSVIFDGADLSFEENVKKTKEAVQYAQSKNPRVLVEGELGYIGSSSKILHALPKGAAIAGNLTDEKMAKDFVRQTKIDLFAPAVGNIHGMLASGANPRLDIQRITNIKKAVGIPLVLHGGSGIVNDDFTEAIAAGVSIIHINTELRTAWRKGVEKGLKENKEEIAPYRLLAPAFENIKRVVEARLRLFNHISRKLTRK